MAGQQETAQGEACVGTVQIPGWKPSRFFEPWKERVVRTNGGLIMQYMHYCRGMPPDIRKEAIDHIMRTSLPVVYVSDDDDDREATDALYHDEPAIREYATRFLDEFWDDYWKPILAKYPTGSESSSQPSSA